MLVEQLIATSDVVNAGGTWNFLTTVYDKGFSDYDASLTFATVH